MIVETKSRIQKKKQTTTPRDESQSYVLQEEH